MDRSTYVVIEVRRVARRNRLLRLFCRHTIINSITKAVIKGRVVDLYAVKTCAICSQTINITQCGYNTKIRRDNQKQLTNCIILDGKAYHHGDKLQCPTCGTPGRLDLANTTEAVFQDSIWRSSVNDCYECTNCWLK